MLRQPVLVLLLCVLACSPAGPRPNLSTSASCTDAPSCERAIVGAEDDALERLLARHAEFTGKRGWIELYAKLRQAKDKPVLLGDLRLDGATTASAPPPAAAGVDPLVLRLARAAGVPHVVIESPRGARQLFPSDRLAPHMLGLPAVVGANREALADEIAGARMLRRMLDSAAQFDYVAAAEMADKLKARVAARPTAEEGAMRARFAVWLVDNAGVALASDGDPAPPSAFPTTMSSPYAEFLAVQLSRPDHVAAWRKRGSRITAGLDPNRMRAIDHMYTDEDSCPAPITPPVEHPSDVAFADLLALALDVETSPGKPPAQGKVAMEDWLHRYETLVQLVDRHGLGWSAVPSLLRQRGELFGLTADGTATYRKVSDLALAHIHALDQLATRHPDRFQPFGILSLVYQPGALKDPRLQPEITALMQKTIGLEIGAAEDTSRLFEAAMTTFIAGLSYPGELQVVQLAALEGTLNQKLGGPFGKRTGWGLAGMHTLHAGLGMLLGIDGAIQRSAPRVTGSLQGDIAQPALARLAISGVRYIELARAGALDASVENPAMFPESRKRARAALKDALAGLSADGPQSAPDKQLLAQLAQIGDELVAAVVSSPSDGPQCSTGDASPNERNAFSRLRKKRKAMIEGHAFAKDASSTWSKRARLIALVASDLIDVLAPRQGDVSWTVPGTLASTIIDAGFAGWIEHAGADLAASGYHLLRSGLDAEASIDTQSAVRAFRALAQLFDADADSGSLFNVLATLGEKAVGGTVDDVGGLLRDYAERAYRSDAPDHGDLLLMAHLAAAVIRGGDVDPKAIKLAKDNGRTVYLPMLMYGPKTATRPADMAQAMRDATAADCHAPNPQALLAARKAISDFKAGRTDAGLDGLEKMLSQAERDGLAVPRQVFRFVQHEGKKVFNVEQSITFGGDLLSNASSFQVGLGFQSEDETRGEMTTNFAGTGNDADEEAARYYAHLALTQSVYAFAVGREAMAVRAARRAIGAWVAGLRLGNSRVVTGNRTAVWTRDATPTLLLAGEMAASNGQLFLAGDLFTLARASFDPGADDEAVAAAFEPLPEPLVGIAALDQPLARAKKTAVMVAGSLPCTSDPGDIAAMARVGCDAYPRALALRASDSVPVLPRLSNKNASQRSPQCRAWADLDRFLAAADEGRYEPKKLIAAATHLDQRGRHHDAASVLARHRHPDHCNPKLVTLARSLAGQDKLGIHLRADLLGIATNCGLPESVDGDLVALDALTEKHALPTRNFEVLLYATRLALKHNRWAPLRTIAKRDGFIQRFNALSPELGTAALLVDHGAAVGAGDEIDLPATMPFYRLLCTTFPPKDRSATCHAITILRGDGTPAEKKRVAAKTLADFLQRAARAVQPSPP